MKSAIRIALAMLCVLLLVSAAQAAPIPKMTPATAIKMSKASVTLNNKYLKPGKVQLKATTVPAQAQLTDNPVRWTSEDERIATVDEKGLVTAVGEGVVKISASVEGSTRTLTASCKVTVKAVRVSSLRINWSGELLLDHTDASTRTQQIPYTIKPATATFQKVTWSTSDERIVRVSEDGVLTAVSAGTAQVTGMVDNGRKKATVNVRVRDASKLIPITISAGGDLILGGDYRTKTDKRFDDFLTDKGAHAPDYDYTLKNLQSLFAHDDLTIVNLECALGNIRNSLGANKSYVFKGKAEYVNILTRGSVEAVNIANNMATSFGWTGYKKTKSVLSNAGVIYSGHNTGEYGEITIKGVKVVIVGMQTPASATTVAKRIKHAKTKTGADVVIMNFHFSDTPQFEFSIKSSMVTQAHAAINAGADLVLGTSSHNLSGIEMYKGKNIVYGLANLTLTNVDSYRRVFVYQQRLLVDLENSVVEAETPTVYPATVTSAPPAAKLGKTVNNHQPTLHAKGSSEYNATIKMIRRYSNYGSIVPAHFNEG